MHNFSIKLYTPRNTSFYFIINSKIMRLIFLLTVLMLSFSTCKKEDGCPPDLPCATQTGENTFGCYINQVAWIAQKAPYILDPSVHKLQAWLDEPGYGTDHNNFLQITATSIDSFAYDFISMTFGAITNIGDINHNFLNTFRIKAYLDGRSGIIAGVYSIDTLSPYEIVLTKVDYNNNIISGHFSFIGLSEDKGDTITVTDGRFDINYYPE